MIELKGGCHCGNLRLAVSLTKPPEEIQPRACQCSFCRKHAALSISDPGGRARIWATRPSEVSRYRFGLKIADFILCMKCGVYVAAVCETPMGLRTVVNCLVLEESARFTKQPAPMSYEGETIEQRLARRAERWMPADVRF